MFNTALVLFLCGRNIGPSPSERKYFTQAEVNGKMRNVKATQLIQRIGMMLGLSIHVTQAPKHVCAQEIALYIYRWVKRGMMHENVYTNHVVFKWIYGILFEWLFPNDFATYRRDEYIWKVQCALANALGLSDLAHNLQMFLP